MRGTDDWRVESQAKEIRRLDKRLYEAENKIRELERRPMEWLLKAELWLCWIFIATVWVFTIVEIATKNS